MTREEVWVRAQSAWLSGLASHYQQRTEQPRWCDDAGNARTAALWAANVADAVVVEWAKRFGGPEVPVKAAPASVCDPSCVLTGCPDRNQPGRAPCEGHTTGSEGSR